MKKGDQEQKELSPNEPNHDPPFNLDGNEQQLSKRNAQIEILNEDNFEIDEGTSRQDQFIHSENAKNVSSKPTPSKPQNLSKEQYDQSNQPVNGFQDSQQQEAAPQFSTNPDVPPLPPTQNPMQPTSQIRTLVTQYGRQLSGNIDPELNFKKKTTFNQGHFKVKRQSYGGSLIRGTDSPPTAGLPPTEDQIQKSQYHKNFTQKLHKAQTNMQHVNQAALSQQRTINLNFFDELQIGLENESSKQMNYDPDKNEKWFQDPNFSVIFKNPKASEQDIDEDRIYESKEFGTHLMIETTSRDGRLNYVNNNIDSSQVHSPIAHQDGSLGERLKKNFNGGGAEKRYQEEQVHYEGSPTDLNPDYLNSHHRQLDQQHYYSQGIRTTTQFEYNTGNQESDGDQFIPRVNLMNRNEKDDRNLLKPRTRQGKHSNKLSINSSNSETSNQNSYLKRYYGQQSVETSRFHRKNNSYIMRVESKNDESDIVNRLHVDPNEKLQLDDRRARMMVVNQMMAIQNDALDNSFFMIVEKQPIEKVDDIEGRCSCILKLLCNIRINVNSTAHYIITSKAFEAISIFVIVANSVSLAIEDPTSTETPFYQEVLDNIFLCLYSIEMVLKILGLGFVFNKGSYLRDPWNMLDFVIVVVGYLSLVLQGGSVNLSGLRSFRVLRPLRSIQRIEGLKVIVTALMNSVPLLRDTLIILLFFFFIFAIAGLQLFQGYLKRRCVHEETGVPHPDDDFCGIRDCLPGYFCGKRNANPNYDQTNFDTIFYALVAIFTSVTLESWTYIMQYIQKSYLAPSFLFFVPLVFIGAFFLLNLTLAVIKSKFAQEHQKKAEAQGKTKKRKKGQVLDFDNLDEEEKKKLIESQVESRKNVLAKWRLILFIKQKMRRSVKKFKLKKQRKELIEQAMKKKEKIRKGLKNYETFFSSENGIEGGANTDNHNELENSNKLNQNDGINSQRQLLSSQHSSNSFVGQQIQLAQLDDKIKGIGPSLTQKYTTGLQNFRQLNQEAIAEEDDEYKTELSHIMGRRGTHLNSGNILKMRRESVGSKGTPKSPQHQDFLSGVRQSSSKILLSPKTKAFVFNENSPHNDERISVFSPDHKQMNMRGMVGMHKEDHHKHKQEDGQRSGKRKKSVKIDHDFFLDFISQDVDILDQKFSEQQLMDIAQQLQDPQNVKNTSQILELIEKEDSDQFSEMSILSDDYNTRKQYQQQHMPGYGTHQSDNDDKNCTPYTQTTAFHQIAGNTIYRQRSKNTQHNFLSQDLTISLEESDMQQNFQTGQDEIIENGEDMEYLDTQSKPSPKSQRDQKEGPLGINVNKTKTLKPEDQKAMYKKKSPKPVNTQKRKESPFQNTSATITTNINQNGTLYSESNGLLKGQYTPSTVIPKSSDEISSDQKINKFSKTKIQPIGPGSYYKTDEPPTQRHGPNTIFNQDYITVEKSVLNSRYVISDHLEKHQKLYLRKDKFDFQSAQDIFEQRDVIHKKIQAEENAKLANQCTKNWTIKPYQRKQIITERIYKPDEEQIEYLALLELDPTELEKLIQKKYDEPYISKLHVTGTLSICINDKKNHLTNKTRKIQDMNLQSFQEELDQNSSAVNLYGPSSMSSQNINMNISAQSPYRRAKSYKTIKVLDSHQQFRVDVSNHIFLKNQSNPIVSKSIKKMKSGNLATLIESRKTATSKNNKSQDTKSEARKREALLNKQAAKDANLQRKLILTALTKDAFRSLHFRGLLTRRRNKLTHEERQKKHIMEIFDMYQDDEEKDEDDDDDEEEDSDDEAIKDDFLDWPINFKAEIIKSKKKAADQKKSSYFWSGQDVLCDFDPQYAGQACAMLTDLRIWPMSFLGLWKRIQVILKLLLRSSFFDNFLTISVAINTVCLALDRVGLDPETAATLTTMNTIFTWIFIVEMCLKIIALGPIKYLKDRMNYLDGIVVSLSIVEMGIMSGSKTGALSAFRAVRIFRIFRVLRVARLLRSLQSMQVIIGVLIKSMNSFIYVFLLLMLFLFIYSLLGMQVFGGSFNFESNFAGPPGVPRTNFDNFNSAFFTAFQAMTMENWPYLLYDGMRSSVSTPISVLYFISWVFLGNFMLLNLFLAVLLDSFTDEKAHKKEDEDEANLREKHLNELAKKEGEELINYYQDLKADGDNKKAAGLNKKKKKKSKKKDENMLDESFEFDKETIMRKQTSTKKKKEDYEGVECERSLYLFHKSNPIRLYLYRTCTHSAFEWIILILIVLSSIKLVIDTYMFGMPEDDPLKVVSDNFDKFFTAAFATESTIKAISFGLMQDNGSYLRETWSQMDFFIVITSIIDAAFENINLPIIKILRLLRTLRPLRFISHNSGMKTIVIALFQSVGGIFNVSIVIIMVWMMFAILAVNLFGGKLNYCTVETFTTDTKLECLAKRGEWKLQDFNFDSVPSAMITLFSLASGENWPDLMYNTINAQGEDLGPRINSTPVNGYFFLVFILIGGMLFLNLFVGVIFKEFEDAIEEEKQAMMLKDSEIQWVDMMKMIVIATPDLETTNIPKQKWRAAIHSFITGGNRSTNYFDIFIMACIVLNMLQMAVNYEGSSEVYNTALDDINYFFTSVFAMECILKLIAFGFSYFRTSWNVFDFCVVCASAFDILMNQMNAASLKFLRVGPQLARVLRVMRVSRLFRLINKYKGLQALLQTIQFSLPQLFNVFALLMLVYFIFAVLGTFLFSTIKSGTVINEYINFSNFGMAMLIVIRMSTGEDWNYIMFDTMRTEADNCIPNETCGFSYSPVYFIPYIMIATFVMLNLFILVIIQQFDKYYLDDNNVINKFKEDLEKFKKAWTQKTKDQNCLRIKDTRLVAFFGEMEKDLGMKGDPAHDIIRNVMQMDLVSDNEGFVYFNELLFKSMRRVYGEKHVKNKILVFHELNALRKIEGIKEKMIKKSRQQERFKAGQVNPFMLKMYMNASFKGWLKLYEKNVEKRNQEKEYGLDKYEMESDDEPDQGKSPEQIAEENWEYVAVDDVEVSDTEFDDNMMDYDPAEEDSPNDNEINSSRMLKEQKKEINISHLKDKSSFEDQSQELPQKSTSNKHQKHPSSSLKQQVDKKEDSQQFIYDQSSPEFKEKDPHDKTKSQKGETEDVQQKMQQPKARKIMTENVDDERHSHQNQQHHQSDLLNSNEEFKSIERQSNSSIKKRKDKVLISSRSGGSRGDFQDDYDQRSPAGQGNEHQQQQQEQDAQNDLVLLKINLQNQQERQSHHKRD